MTPEELKDGLASLAYVAPQWSGVALVALNALTAAEVRIGHLEKACQEQSHSIEQTLGQMLGYPWYKDDQKNFPGATEKDGVCVGECTPEDLAQEAADKIRELQAKVTSLQLWRAEALIQQRR